MFLARSDKPLSGRILAAAIACALAAGLLLAHVTNGDAQRVQIAKKVTKPAWLPKMRITEYYSARESWFAGKRIKTPGVSGRKSRIDWLYSAQGMSMQGDGLGTDGKRYHIDNLGSGGWVGRDGKKADWGSTNRNRTPFWRSSGFWRNKNKAVTFQLENGNWYNGKGKKWVAPKGITFAPGPSLPLKYYRSVATDLNFIPRGSLVWIGRYRDKNGDGWMRADDTGGAIVGRHIDVYIKSPKEIGGAESYNNQRIYVVPKAKIKAYLKREKAEDKDGLPLPPSSLY